MSEAAKAEQVPEQEDAANKDWGFEYLFNRFTSWTELLSTGTQKTYMIGSILLSVILVGTASILAIVMPRIMPDIVQALIAFPASILIFAVVTGLVHNKRDVDKLTIREKYSFAQRRRVAIFASVILIVLLFATGSSLPYAVGGTLLLTGILFIYNFFRRTPDEINLDQAGLIDPRDLSDEELAIAQSIEDGTLDLDDEFFEDEEEEEKEEENLKAKKTPGKRRNRR